MKKVFFYVGVSGRTKFVTLTEQKGYKWSDEPMPVKYDSSLFHPFSKLKGRIVEFQGIKGKIIGCNPLDNPLTGKYISDNKYFPHKPLLSFNHLVQVYWIDGVLPCWQPFFKLKIL